MNLDNLFSRFSSRHLPDGWFGWVHHEQLPMPTAKRAKTRPWCRGRAKAGRVEWFPRTAKKPREGDRYGVWCPADPKLGFSKPGWFVVNVYVPKAEGFAPAAKQQGTVDDAMLSEIYKRLETFYWDKGK